MKDLSASSSTGVVWQLFREEKRGEVSEAQEIAACCYKDFTGRNRLKEGGRSPFSVFSGQ